MESPDASALRVPVGADADRWTTRSARRRVPLVAHNVTSAGRLLDVLPLFHNDFRVQLLVTSTGSSPFQGGLTDLFADLALPVLPWHQALTTPVDLAISASFGDQLPLLHGKLTTLPHGDGYTKKLAVAGHTGTEPTFGLSPAWLLADGEPYVDGLVLSHPEQRERLRRAHRDRPRHLDHGGTGPPPPHHARRLRHRPPPLRGAHPQPRPARPHGDPGRRRRPDRVRLGPPRLADHRRHTTPGRHHPPHTHGRRRPPGTGTPGGRTPAHATAWQRRRNWSR
ncbi:hypothetical protein OYE22_17720 [Streptomyces sp. 71268]|uniref:hypothetical protein n=1 Tax=Streptomyces sp. 71268 TaxID=3002640 RepID=UPI0023F84649|nr:hypothetical protein [Streptomyces sp. 71268]WEV26828.1 hypothetical protein OYE22_17720 [Streptomyces sp. 71268]